MKNDTKFTNDDMPKKSSGKGFYIALAVCLVAVCGVAVSSFVSGLTKDAPKTDVTGTTGKVRTTTSAQQVVIPATNIKDERTTTAPTTKSTRVTPTTTQAADLFVFPATNRVLLGFSDALIYSQTLEEWVTHNGTDFAAEQGAQVKAVGRGTVLGIYRDSLWGDVVEIDHGGKVISRCYGVKASKNVYVGQLVNAGDIIGTVADIPAEVLSDSHIHLEISANDKYVDPLLLIRGEAVMAEPKEES